MAKMGRPKVFNTEADLKKLKSFMRLKPTLKDTADFFECDANTIERVIKKEFGTTFGDFRDQNMVHTRFNLIRNALSMADKGNVPMMIFCLKNLCGWKDKHEISTEDDRAIKLAYKAYRE